MHINPPFHKNSYKKTAVILTAVIVMLTLVSLLALFDIHRRGAERCTAYIYQNGELLYSIDLSTVTESSSFVITDDTGGTNTVEVRPGSIGISDADCPDRLCVRQGFIENTLLPITCLPHGLVIELHRTEISDTPDTITY